MHVVERERCSFHVKESSRVVVVNKRTAGTTLLPLLSSRP
ncbi:hypothetical protein roselon_01586 [Roseibacterium elongatum DSM 19469]|uniref:Uncharacterized protein n=1 Tax=Roseicyclus elongatus DSM 19469 TaxID=1294273 RepID=W8RS99_9RHOB|nr:hypothetical protein roselon_01586 [Roseibacterium elongatum DSM 19469]